MLNHFILILYHTKINFLLLVYISLTVRCKKFKIVSFASPYKKNIALFPARSSFPVKLIGCIASESASSTSCLVNLLQSAYDF